MAFPVNVDSTWVNPGSVALDAGELRRADTALFGGVGSALGVGGGIVRHGDTSLAVTIDASDNVTIQPGAVVIPGNAVSGTGCYRSALPAATTNVLTARNATNPRIDLIVFRQMDTDVVAGHGAYTGRIEAIAGTPSATPTAPALPSMAVELARITVPATGGGTATVDSSFRTYAHAVGGQIVVPTAARLPASVAKYQQAVALDTGKTHTWDGTAWGLPDGFTSISSIASGWTAETGNGVMKVGNLVIVSIVAQRSGATITNNSATIWAAGTIPAALRPSAEWRAGFVSGTSQGRGRVLADGSVLAVDLTIASSDRLAGQIVYGLGLS